MKCGAECMNACLTLRFNALFSEVAKLTGAQASTTEPDWNEEAARDNTNELIKYINGLAADVSTLNLRSNPWS